MKESKKTKKNSTGHPPRDRITFYSDKAPILPVR